MKFQIPNKLAVIVNFKKKNAIAISKKIIAELLNQKKTIYITEKLSEKIKDENCIIIDAKQIPKFVNTIIAIGGDGTFIGVAREYSQYAINILPINIGFLGFLSELTAEQFLENSNIINSNDIYIEKRMILEYTIENNKGFAINEITISPRTISRLITINVNINNQHFTNIRADGIIVSTPTGSTGHSLSAGGPIVNPNLNCIAFTPLSAHSLAIRPIILSAEDMVELSYTSKKLDSAAITIDGQLQIPLKKNISIIIRSAKHTFNIVKLNKIRYYDLIKTKLKWNQ